MTVLTRPDDVVGLLRELGAAPDVPARGRVQRRRRSGGGT
jgi:hypothetical protein